MGLMSWLFPNEEDRLRRVRAKMAAGEYAAELEKFATKDRVAADPDESGRAA